MPEKRIRVRARLGLTKMVDGLIVPILKSSLKGLTANLDTFSKPSVNLGEYSAAISAYEDSLPAAMDGGKTAVEQKNKLRDVAIGMYALLARYVEHHCNDDMATFLLSGFQAVPSTRTQTPPASESIRKVEPGANSGQIKVTLMPFRRGKSYELRWATVPAGGVPANWITIPLTHIRPATLISDLTPGTVYAFQVRALADSRFTDWSDSVTFMCT
jgi:hypothetical protein